MHTKVGRALAAVAAVGAVVSGCGGPVQAGSAAVVGDTTVPLEQVQNQLGTLLARVPADQRQQDTGASLARDIVTNELLHDLITRAAVQQGITVTDAQVDAFIEQQGGADALLQNPCSTSRGCASRRTTSSWPPTSAAAPAAPGAGRHHLDLVGSPNRADAEAKGPRARRGQAAADAVQDSRTAQKACRSRPSPTRRTRAAWCSTPVGEVVAYQPDPQQATWNVFRVTERQTDARPADPSAASALSLQQLYLIGQRTLSRWPTP